MNKWIYLFFAIIPTFIFAQDTLKNTEVISIRNNTAKTPFRVITIDMKAPNSLAFGNLADAIEKSGQAFVQKSQGGGGSIVLRGFEASRILMVIDGVRMNNAMYRTGHLQNAITVDPNSVANIALLPGSHGTAFGSDALGGVVAITTKTIMPTMQNKITKVNGQAKINFATATNEWKPNIDLAMANKNWGSYTNISYSKFGAIVQGNNRTNSFANFGKVYTNYAFINNIDSFTTNNNVNSQKAANYTQVDILEKLVYRNKENAWHTFNLQYSNSSNIPRTDRLQERNANNGLPVHAEWYYGPQKRFLISHKYITKLNGWFNDLQSLLAYQVIEESRINRRYRNYTLQTRTENIKVLSYSLDLNKKINKSVINTGIDIQYNDLKSIAAGRNVLTNVASLINTRYPGGANKVLSVAFFGIYKYRINDNLIAEAGARANYNYLKSTFLSTTVFPVPFSNAQQSYIAPTGHAAITFDKKIFKAHLIYTNGFRSPNVDDLAKVFESVAGILIVPNNNLKPEYTQSFEGGFAVAPKNFNLDLSAYYTKLNNFIAIKPGLYNGQPTFNYLGAVSNILTNVNFDKGFIYGLQMGISYNYAATKTTTILFSGSYNYTYGRLVDAANAKTPLDHIPPAFGKIMVTLKKPKTEASIFIIGNSKKELSQYRLNAEDNEIYATTAGTLGWRTLNIEGFYKINKTILVRYGITNILDKNYRLFASGISAPGRNFIGGLAVSF